MVDDQHCAFECVSDCVCGSDVVAHIRVAGFRSRKAAVKRIEHDGNWRRVLIARIAVISSSCSFTRSIVTG